MLRVILEIVPFGLVEQTQVIGGIRIGNDGSGDQHTGNYQYTFHENLPIGNPRTGFIKNYKRAKGAWELVRLILEQEKENYARETPQTYTHNKRKAAGSVRGRVRAEERGEEPSDSEYYNRGTEGPPERIQGERSA